MINGITPVGLSSKCKNRIRIKPYAGTISEDLVDHIRSAPRRKPEVIVMHTGANEITNDYCSSPQINLNTGVSYGTISINKSRPVFHHSTSFQEQYQCKLYGRKKLYLNDAGKSLLANNFINYR